jgi:general secretion pathway protein C
MEFRLNDRHIIALNILLVAVLAWFAANSVNDIIRMRLTPDQTAVPRAASKPVDDGTANLTRPAYQRIVNRDIFNLVPVAPVHVAVEENIDLHLNLIGVSTSSKGKPFAILETRNGEQEVYRVGEAVKDAGKLVEVDADRVIIDHNGKRVAINLPKDDMPGPVVGAQPIEVPAEVDSADSSEETFDPNVEDLGDNKYKIPRATVEHSITNLSSLFTQIRAMPNIQNGKTNGFALSEIEPGSVFDEMGIQEGDVLRNVNGQPITDPAQAMTMLTALRNQTQINIQILRDGEPVTLNYQIH